MNAVARKSSGDESKKDPAAAADKPRRSRSDSDLVTDMLRTHIIKLALTKERGPTESELIAALGVGRSALREALARLESLGLLMRRHGARLELNSPALESVETQPFGIDFEGQIIKSGRKPSYELVDHKPCLIDEQTAALLDCAVHSPALRIRRRLRADKVPVVLSDATIRVRALPLPEFDVLAKPRLLALDLFGEETLWLNTRPTARIADAELAALLEIGIGDPLLVLEIVGAAARGLRPYRLSLTSVPDRISWGFIDPAED